MSRIRDDLSNQRFSKLLVIDFSHRDIRYKSYWNCICDCGTECKIRSDALSSHDTVSCGCHRRWIAQKHDTDKDRVLSEIYSKYKTRAKKKKWDFTFTLVEFIELTQSDCHYCGVIPHRLFKTKSGKNFAFNGLDRIDSSKGYTANNVVPCCTLCNRAKMDMSYAEFMQYLRRIANKYKG